MSGPTVLFVDLDGTLIHRGSQFTDGGAVRHVEFFEGGTSAMSVAAIEQLTLLSKLAIIVPATTRSMRQFERLHLPEVRRSGWAVVSNGARILTPQGEDLVWRERTRRAVDAWCHDVIRSTHRPRASGIEALADLVTSSAPEADSVRVVDRAFIVIIALDADRAQRAVRSLAEKCRELAGSVTRQGRKVYVVPPPAQKHLACSEISRRLGAERVIAAGDSDLDAGMLARADVSFIPAGSSLARAGVDGAFFTTAAAPQSTVELLHGLGIALASGRCDETVAS
jgi:hydroxymethylpyrimidine pyrophosphatase-like HAD family hydrolase